MSWLLQRLYAPVLHLALRLWWIVVLLAMGAALTVLPAFERLGAEFIPPLYEGTILYMPTTLPGLLVTAATQLLQKMDQTRTRFPKVERVFGKAGRAETSTDPAPFSMMEVVVQLKPTAQWRPGLTYALRPVALAYRCQASSGREPRDDGRDHRSASPWLMIHAGAGMTGR